MFNRRSFLSLAVGSIAAPGLSAAQPASQKVALYANVGADLTHYDVDVAGAELVKRATVTLPAACNMPGRMYRGAISMSRPAAVRQVMVRPGPSITSLRSASIRGVALSRLMAHRYDCRRAPST